MVPEGLQSLVFLLETYSRGELDVAHYCALYSVVFMMGFVGVFDSFHRRKRLMRMLGSIEFLTTAEVGQLRAIWTACQDSDPLPQNRGLETEF